MLMRFTNTGDGQCHGKLWHEHPHKVFRKKFMDFSDCLCSLFHQGENIEFSPKKILQFSLTYFCACIYLITHCSFIILHFTVLLALIRNEDSFISLLLVLQVVELKSAISKQGTFILFPVNFLSFSKCRYG